jgi:DNA-binding CsgD family transcriptional regulator
MKGTTEWLPEEPRVASMLEAAYRVDLDEQAWSEGLLRAFQPSIPGDLVLAGCRFSCSGEPNAELKLSAISSTHEAVRGWLAAPRSPEENWLYRRLFLGRTWARTASELIGEEMPRLLEYFASNGIHFRDSWAVVGSNISREGYFLSVAIPRRIAPFPPSLLRHWDRIAAHLSAAFCLRENMARGLAPGEGVLAPDGKLLHAEGPARLPDARSALRFAVRSIDAARSRHRHDPEASLQAWRAVVSGRWSLVEQHERDGKRFLLARVNELQAPGSKALSSRERQVLGLVAQGSSNKEIAYRLGIGEPSVAGYLRRGRAKIGLKNRADLLRWWEQQVARRE